MGGGGGGGQSPSLSFCLISQTKLSGSAIRGSLYLWGRGGGGGGAEPIAFLLPNITDKVVKW